MSYREHELPLISYRSLIIPPAGDLPLMSGWPPQRTSPSSSGLPPGVTVSGSDLLFSADGLWAMEYSVYVRPGGINGGGLIGSSTDAVNGFLYLTPPLQPEQILSEFAASAINPSAWATWLYFSKTIAISAGTKVGVGLRVTNAGLRVVTNLPERSNFALTQIR